MVQIATDMNAEPQRMGEEWFAVKHKKDVKKGENINEKKNKKGKR